MKQRRTDTKRYSSGMAIGLCMIFLMCIMANSSLNTFSSRYVATSGAGSKLTNGQSSMQQAGKTYFFKAIYENVISHDIEYHLISSRNIQDVQNIIFRAFNLLTPFIGQAVLVYCFKYVIKKKKKIKSIMAISLGGHAPPQNFTC